MDKTRTPCAGPPSRFAHSHCQTAPQRVRIASAAPSTGRAMCDKSVGVVANCRAVFCVRSQNAQSYLFAKGYPRIQNSLKNKNHNVSSQPSFGKLVNRFIQCTPVVCKPNSESESRGCQASDKACSHCQCSERTLGELHCAACQCTDPELANSFSQSYNVDQKNVGCDATCSFESYCQTSASNIVRVKKGSSEGQSGFIIERYHPMNPESKWKSEDCPCDNSQCACTSEIRCPMHCESERRLGDCPLDVPRDNTQCACTSVQNRLHPNTCSTCCSWDGTPNQSGQEVHGLCHRCSPYQGDPATLNTLHRNKGFSETSPIVNCASSRDDSGPQRGLSRDNSGIHCKLSRDSTADHRQLSKGKYGTHRALHTNNSGVCCNVSRDTSIVQCELSKEFNGVQNSHPRYNAGIHKYLSRDNSDAHHDFSNSGASRNISRDKIEYLLHSRFSAQSFEDKRALRDHVESLLRSIYSDQETSRESLVIMKLLELLSANSHRTKPNL